MAEDAPAPEPQPQQTHEALAGSGSWFEKRADVFPVMQVNPLSADAVDYSPGPLMSAPVAPAPSAPDVPES